MTEYLRVGKHNQLVRVAQDPKTLEYVGTVVSAHPRPSSRADTIEEAVDLATGVGR